uniref:Uncharacterized protein n=1 Tax=Rhizophora mucronata TaxID=61149 RepID=A0A2P2PHR8_RHIMU
MCKRYLRAVVKQAYMYMEEISSIYHI